MLKCDLNKVTKHGFSPVNLLYIFRSPFPENISGWMLLLLQITFSFLTPSKSLFKYRGTLVFEVITNPFLFHITK